MVFTGDTLLIRGTGRTDFQNGDAKAHYHSLFNRLLTLPSDTFVYPGHDYKGENLSTIRREIETNPRLQVSSQSDYVQIMDALNLPRPEMMDVAVPANMAIGDDDLTDGQRWLSTQDAASMFSNDQVKFIDLRESAEIERLGTIPGAIHHSFPSIKDNIDQLPTELLSLLEAPDQLILFCAHGERSALAQQVLLDADLPVPWHLRSGYSSWTASGYPTTLDKPH